MNETRQDGDPRSDRRERAPLEWELSGEFKENGLAVRVNRAKQSRRFSLEVGGLSQSGEPRRFIQLRWEVEAGAVVIKEPADTSVLSTLLARATSHVKEILEKEGVQNRRAPTEREPMRKGKTERDRNKHKNRRAEQA
jgi:hypothetical protein